MAGFFYGPRTTQFSCLVNKRASFIMTKDPAVLFYTSDFLSGTSFYTYEERGQYITLLCQQHQKGGIPEKHILSVCGSKENIVFKQFSKGKDGFFYNERMRSESEKRYNFVKSRKDNLMGSHKGELMENENEDENKDKRFRKPTLKQVKEYCKDIKSKTDPEVFFDNYESSGWIKANGQKVKNWKATIRTWDKRGSPDQAKTAAGSSVMDQSKTNEYLESLSK